MKGTALVRRLAYWLVLASVVALVVAPVASMSATLQTAVAQDDVGLAEEATPSPDVVEPVDDEDATEIDESLEEETPATPIPDDVEEPSDPPADEPSDDPAIELATTVDEIIITLWCFDRNPELTRVDNLGADSIQVISIASVFDGVENTAYPAGHSLGSGKTRIYRSNTGATTGTILTTDSLYTSTAVNVTVKVETSVGTIEQSCGTNPNAQVTYPADVAITLTCNKNPEMTRIHNTGTAQIIIYSLETLGDAGPNEPYVLNRPLGAGKTVIYRSGSGAVSGTILTTDFIYTDDLWEADGVRLDTSIGVIEKACDPAPPPAPPDVSVTISCATAPEKVTVKNFSDYPVTITSLTSLYAPIAQEPFSLNKTLQPGKGIIYRSGTGTGANFLTTNFIYTESQGTNEGVQITLSTGHKFTTRCGAWGTKWIEVNLSTQVLTAWQGQQVIATSYVSTGKDGFWTPTGTFYINSKPGTIDMAGCAGGECWYVPNVPASMAFTYVGHYIHGAYWHNNFGISRGSHGCVNLPVDFSWWLFNWTPMWTEVRIHY